MLPILEPGRRSSSEPKRISYGGNDVTFLASGAETAGAYALVEFVTAPNPGRVPPPHRHPNLDEGFYVIEGTLAMLVGDHSVTISAGSFLNVPRGVVHQPVNPGNTPVRYLVLCVPAGLENYFAELGEVYAESGGPNQNRLLALYEKYDVQLA